LQPDYRGIYRSVIIATAGLILLGANNPSKNSTGNTRAAKGNQKAGHNENITAGVSRIGSELEAQKRNGDSYEKERNEREMLNCHGCIISAIKSKVNNKKRR
jgi:hypothetical protein